MIGKFVIIEIILQCINPPFRGLSIYHVVEVGRVGQNEIYYVFSTLQQVGPFFGHLLVLYPQVS